jgi:hypothetical protein
MAKWRNFIGPVALAVVTVACGHKGPPLPPLIHVPVPPGDFLAERRGSNVDLTFTVPATNTDGSRPANIERVEIYAYDGFPPRSDIDLLKQARRIASIDVKAPSDPNQTVEADESDEDLEPLEGKGLDQGGPAHVDDQVLKIELPVDGPEWATPVRTYIGIGINTKGRRGPASRRTAVSLGPAPPPPSSPVVEYDDQRIELSWDKPASISETPDPAASSRTSDDKTAGFFVYEHPEKGSPVRLNGTPVAETTFADRRKEKIVWGAERCYAVSTVHEVEGLPVESEPSAPVCVNLVDTFPPKAPAGLQAVPSQHVISLIWNENAETDLAGYLVLRGPSEDGPLEAITPAPIADAHYEDAMAEPGMTLFYAIVAVDKAGNRSQPSDAVSAAAR